MSGRVRAASVKKKYRAVFQGSVYQLENLSQYKYYLNTWNAFDAHQWKNARRL